MKDFNITEKNIVQTLTGMVKADDTQRERLQACVVFAIEHARNNSNSFNYLDRVIATCYLLTMGRPTIMRDFVKHCIPGVVWTKAKGSDEYHFRKESKGTKVRYLYQDASKIPNWWEWAAERKGSKKKPFDPVKAVKALARRMAKEGVAGSVDQFERQIRDAITSEGFGEIFADAGETVDLKKAA